jgi:hypothetical protein
MRGWIVLAMALLSAAPAWAQRDTMRMGENLGAVIIRPQRPPDQQDGLQTRESLEKAKQQAEPAPPGSRQGGDKR